MLLRCRTTVRSAQIFKITEERLPYSQYDIDREMHSLLIIMNSKRGADVPVARIFLLLFLPDENVVDYA